jgi:uncharacterized membrane protein
MAKNLDTHFRSLIKGVVYRLFGSLATMIIAYILTGELDKSMQIGGLDLVVKIFLYYVYERMWNFVSWGRSPVKVLSETTDERR